MEGFPGICYNFGILAQIRDSSGIGRVGPDRGRIGNAQFRLVLERLFRQIPRFPGFPAVSEK